jgi:hypothetical protein
VGGFEPPHGGFNIRYPLATKNRGFLASRAAWRSGNTMGVRRIATNLRVSHADAMQIFLFCMARYPMPEFLRKTLKS